MLPPKAFQPVATLRPAPRLLRPALHLPRPAPHLLIVRVSACTLVSMDSQSHSTPSRWPAAALALVFTSVLLLSPACSLGCQFAPSSSADSSQSTEHHHDSSAPASAPEAPCGTHPHLNLFAKRSITALVVPNSSTAPVVFHSAASAASTFPGHLLSSVARSSSWSLLKEPVLPHLSVLRI